MMTPLLSALSGLFRLPPFMVAVLLLAGCPPPSPPIAHPTNQDDSAESAQSGQLTSQPVERDSTVDNNGSDQNATDLSVHKPSHPLTPPDSPGIPGLLWSHTFNGEVQGYPSVIDGVMYIELKDGSLFALDAGSGEILLHHALDTPQYLTPVGNGVAYFGSQFGQVFALDAESFDLRWRFDAGDQLTGYPRASEEAVYFSTSGTLYSLDAYTGELRWRYDEKERPSFHPFSRFDGTILFFTSDGYLYAFDAESGSQRWRWQEVEYQHYTLELVGDMILASYSYDGKLYAVDAASGETVWRFDLEIEPGTRATVANGSVYFYTLEGPSDDRVAHIYALDAASGKKEWRNSLAAGDELFGRSFSVAGETVYFGSANGTVYAMDATSGRQKWRFETGDEEVGSFTVAENVVYVVTERLGVFTGIIHALDAASGDLLWRSKESMDGLSSELKIADGVIYASADDGGVYGLDAATDGEILWRLRTGRRVWSPVLVDGVLYAAAERGDVYAVDLPQALQANAGHRAQDVATAELLWRYDAGAELYEAPTAAGGVVYAGTPEGNVYAVDAESGEPLWGFEPDEKAMYAWPAVSEDIVYDATKDGFVTALDAASGEILWRKKVGETIHFDPSVSDGVLYLSIENHDSEDLLNAFEAASGESLWQFELGDHFVELPPEVAGDTLYVGTRDGHMNALNAASGAVRWRYATGTEVFNVPVIAGGAVYFGASDDFFYALDASGGNLLWRLELGKVLGTHPTVVEGIVYLGTRDGNLFALDAGDGEQLWLFAADGSLSTPTVAEGVIYVGSTDGFLYALDAANGKEIWQRFFPLGGKDRVDLATSEDGWKEVVYTCFTPTFIEGVLYVAMEDGSFYALDAATGESLWRYKTGDYIYSPPAVADGVVYVGSLDGYLYAFKAPQPSPAADR